MMPGIIERLRARFARVRALPAGMHAYQTPPGAELPFRMHLRLDPDGSGLLIVNATTVLHLNQTAAEYAYHRVQSATPEAAAREISRRYRVGFKQAMHDYLDFCEKVETLAQTVDLDPVTYLDFDRNDPYSGNLSSPYRLDCALTYRLPGGDGAQYAPGERVKAELATGDWQRMLEKAWAVGIPHVVFTGGEPTLREDLADLIAHAEKIGQVTGLLSGGASLADPAYLESLLASGLDHLMLLLQTQADSSWTALRNAMAADLYTTAHITLHRELAGRIDPVLDKLAALEVKSLSISASDSQGAEALGRVRNRIASLGISLAWDLPVPYSPDNPVSREIGSPSSGAGRGWLYVEPDGDVLPEQGVNRVLGNLLHDPWDAIWQKVRTPVAD